ncbi:hypothetical protein TREES_T100013924 [Tupaia chinensis]|uniref:Uncharacterized protein n=1 Tax=Tupaia chinensis TaxID=246437 RepID=L9KUP7_TUPCH|nr:hypothetical protein TREES_T100013924 [Tupaia chinensis]
MWSCTFDAEQPWCAPFHVRKGMARPPRSREKCPPLACEGCRTSPSQCRGGDCEADFPAGLPIVLFHAGPATPSEKVKVKDTSHRHLSLAALFHVASPGCELARVAHSSMLSRWVLGSSELVHLPLLLDGLLAFIFSQWIPCVEEPV